MRALAISLLFVAACQAQSDENRIAATVSQLERAEQAGDANTLIGLCTRAKAADLEKMRPYIRPQPQRYQVARVYAQGDDAVVLAQVVIGSFVTITLRRENGEWKIADEMFRDSAADVNSVYAIIPPASGAFLRAGSDWSSIAPQPAQPASRDWRMRAVFDESYLYIRFETNADLPAPGSTIQKPPSGWPVLKIDVAGGNEYALYDACNVGDQATFDENGKANSHRAFAAYMMRLEKNHREVFSATAGTHPDRLIDVAGHNYEMRVPLLTLGITDPRTAKITVGDAQWPKSALVSIDVPRYPR